jgi:hypothetical protein
MYNIVTCLTEGNDRIQDTVTPFLERQKVSWIHSRLGIVALHGCLATMVECFPLGQPDVVRGRQYTIVSWLVFGSGRSQSLGSESVYASACVSRHQLVDGIRRVSAWQ